MLVWLPQKARSDVASRDDGHLKLVMAKARKECWL
jgi:hypothetical protein